jgi:hypothetical protein
MRRVARTVEFKAVLCWSCQGSYLAVEPRSLSGLLRPEDGPMGFKSGLSWAGMMSRMSLGQKLMVRCS